MSSILRSLRLRKPNELSFNELCAVLLERHTADTVPPCRICGEQLTVCASGGGAAPVWGCSGREVDLEDDTKIRYKEGRSLADDHFDRSRWTQHQTGDDFVLELITRARLNIKEELP